MTSPSHQSQALVEFMFACADMQIVETLLDEPIGHLGILAENFCQSPVARGQPARFLSEQEARGEARLAPRSIGVTAFAVHCKSMERRQRNARWTFVGRVDSVRNDPIAKPTRPVLRTVGWQRVHHRYHENGHDR